MDPTRERIENLLLVLLECLRDGGAVDTPDHRRLRDQLAAHGLDESDLGELLEWLTDGWWRGDASFWLDSPDAESPSPRAVRLLAETERRYLSPDAQGYLVELRQSGQISWRQFEFLVHLASLGDGTRLRRSDVENLLDQIVAADAGIGFRGLRDEPRHH
ncbi:MAG: DUF494 family protein [Candidatus Krumholzibacteriia bacterium]